MWHDRKLLINSHFMGLEVRLFCQEVEDLFGSNRFLSPFACQLTHEFKNTSGGKEGRKLWIVSDRRLTADDHEEFNRGQRFLADEVFHQLSVPVLSALQGCLSSDVQMVVPCSVNANQSIKLMSRYRNLKKIDVIQVKWTIYDTAAKRKKVLCTQNRMIFSSFFKLTNTVLKKISKYWNFWQLKVKCFNSFPATSYSAVIKATKLESFGLLLLIPAAQKACPVYRCFLKTQKHDVPVNSHRPCFLCALSCRWKHFSLARSLQLSLLGKNGADSYGRGLDLNSVH